MFRNTGDLASTETRRRRTAKATAASGGLVGMPPSIIGGGRAVLEALRPCSTAPRGPTRNVEDDETLLRSCRAGDEAAWKTLVERYSRLVYSVPCKYGLSGPEAEEVLQNVLVKFVENVRRLRQSESLPAWLVTVARNECHRRSRVMRRLRSVDLDDVEPSKVSEDPPDVIHALHAVQCEHALARAMERLDPDSRNLLTALYLEQPRPSYTEIAKRRGTSIGSVGPTRARCLARLRTLYEEQGGPALEPGMGCA